MAIIITDVGKQKALEYLVGKDTTTESLVLKLYSNNVTPDIEDTIATYTEVTGGGYSAKTLSVSNWSVSAGESLYPQQTWTFTGAAGPVYGYYITRPSVISVSSYNLSSSTTTTTEAISLGEQYISVTSDTSFSVNSYVKLAANNQSVTPFEIVRILYKQSNVLYVDRAQLSTSQLSHVSGVTATLLTITEDTTNTDVIFAERFSGAPYTVATNGDIIKVTLNITLI